MIILIRKRHIAVCALFCCFLAGLSAVLWHGRGVSAAPAFSARDGVPVTVIVDPGHGGEDGGAVAGDGLAESHLNLEIALRVNDLLRFSGQRTVMTRTEDVSIYDQGAGTLHEKKVSDLQNRVALVNGTENAVLLSIHQNSLPSSPRTQGAQVFWNQQEGAEELAAAVQDRLNQAVNPGRAKTPKQIASTIYLMKNVTAPGVIVECGFLSNEGETARLREAPYQRRLAAAVAAGYLACLAGEGGT